MSGEVEGVPQRFSSDGARARARGFDTIASEVLEIADDARNERMQLLAKWDPKRYGKRTVIAGNPEAPLLSKPISLEGLTPEQKRAIASIKIPD